MDVRIVGVHNRYRAPVDKGKPVRKCHKNRLVPLVSLFPDLFDLHRHSHVWISGIDACLGSGVALLVYCDLLFPFSFLRQPKIANDRDLSKGWDSYSTGISKRGAKPVGRDPVG